MGSSASMKRPSVANFECPVCGATVRTGARACPECGADERTGWDEEATRYDGLDLPEAAFADDGDSDSSPSRKPASFAAGFWRLVALILTIVVIGVLVRG